MQIEEMNKKEVEKIEKIIEKNYGVKIKFKDILLKTSKDKIWIVSKDFKKNFFKNLKVNSIGLYFGRLKRNEKIKLSLEGAQLVGKKATKNLVEIDENELISFLQGFNVKKFKEKNAELNNFVVVKFKEDIVGIGILRSGYIENLLPKSRRIYIEIKKT